MEEPIENECTGDSGGKNSENIQSPLAWKLGRWRSSELCEEVGKMSYWVNVME